ncbi:hypothetical protein [Haloarchaeobius amylolyticus]|uniref:hypothetical protein n=1 Tax=Haloarchaeobius amylolyticus TaxID=1198296 RepID=UPI002270A5BF|nr:hypothetical protein [Haloarchaeobius amylolyticus]
MVDDRLLRRLDWLLAVLSVWLGLTLVLGSFALMTVNLGIGIAALATVVLTVTVAVLSYLRSSGIEAEAVVEAR